MYIFAQERIAQAGWSGQQTDNNGNPVIHLHIEFRDGTSEGHDDCDRNTGPNGEPAHCYIGIDNEYHGRPMSWHEIVVADYKIFGFADPNGSRWFNYEGSAIVAESGDFNTKTVDAYFDDPTYGLSYAQMTVHRDFTCPSNSNVCEVNLPADKTIFATTHGCLDESCLTRRDANGTDDGGFLTSDHSGQVVSYDPNFPTLATPNPNQSTAPTAIGLETNAATGNASFDLLVALFLVVISSCTLWLTCIGRLAGRFKRTNGRGGMG